MAKKKKKYEFDLEELDELLVYVGTASRIDRLRREAGEEKAIGQDNSSQKKYDAARRYEQELISKFEKMPKGLRSAVQALCEFRKLEHFKFR